MNELLEKLNVTDIVPAQPPKGIKVMSSGDCGACFCNQCGDCSDCNCDQCN